MFLCLKSFLSDNSPAQIRFVNVLEGPAVLEQALMATLSSPSGSKKYGGPPTTNEELLIGLLTLASDIVTEDTKTPSDDRKVIRAFTTEAWCTGVTTALMDHDTHAAIPMVAVKALVVMAPFCRELHSGNMAAEMRGESLFAKVEEHRRR